VDRDELERHLSEVARSSTRSGRGAQARVQALKALGRFDRPRVPEAQPMPEGWHPGPPEMEELDRHDESERRERWWAALVEEGLLE
jgi:hypothetical protein